MIAPELLAHAKRILAGAGADGLNARIAAFLARQALEEIVDGRLSDRGVSAPWANSRSKLIILRALDDADAAQSAQVAWNRLSQACHVHAFEMQPSTTEVTHLSRQVASLLPAGESPE
jgi:hypothetical protein